MDSTTVFRNYTYHYGNYTATLTEEARVRGYRNERKSARFRQFMVKLISGKPVRVVLFGGSVSNGNGLANQGQTRFSKQFERWLQESFPVKAEPGEPKQVHRVANKAVGATDSCFLARTLPMRMSKEGDAMPGTDQEGTLGSFEEADLVILEFGVNDLQSALGMNTLPPDLYSTLQSDILPCMEAVVQQLLSAKDDLAIMFLEYTSGKLWEAVTAEAVHELVADRYGLPLLSYRKSVFPEVEKGEHISNCLFNDKVYGQAYPKEASIRGHIDCNNRFKYFQKGGFGTLQLDGTHPSPLGHKLLTDLLAYAFQVEAAAMNKPVTPVPETSTPYAEIFGATQPKPHGHYKTEDGPFLGFTNNNAIGGFTETWDSAGILRDPVARVELPTVHLLGYAADAAECMELCLNYKGPKEAICHSVVWGSSESKWPNLDQGQCYARTDQVWAPAAHLDVYSYRRTDIEWPIIAGGLAAMEKKVAELTGDRLMVTATSWGNGPFTIAEGGGRSWFNVKKDKGWEYRQDVENKFGWIYDSAEAGKSITFTVKYKLFRDNQKAGNKDASKTTTNDDTLFAWTLGFLASYDGMAKFDCEVSCKSAAGGDTTKSLEIDGLWAKKLSVYQEQELFEVPLPDECSIKITSKAQESGRTGNKIKILALSINARAED
jgi:lysophospholipase L1-like esterase